MNFQLNSTFVQNLELSSPNGPTFIQVTTYLAPGELLTHSDYNYNIHVTLLRVNALVMLIQKGCNLAVVKTRHVLPSRTADLTEIFNAT